MFNRLTSAQVPAAGVIAASGGNAGLAVAYAARELGHRAEVFVPVSSPAVKVARLRALGAAVTVAGAHYAEALEASRERAAQTGALVVHAYDQPEVVAGQGTLALELAAQAPDLDTVLVAVGGGGLVGGVLAAYDGSVRVVAVEPERCPTLHAALAAGRPVDVEVGGVAADSLGARRLGDVCFGIVQRLGVTSVLVSDPAIVAARRALWEQARVAAEDGGAAALAALTSGRYRPGPGERVGVIVCGANTDPSTLLNESL
jgi:threonine dehydratase